MNEIIWTNEIDKDFWCETRYLSKIIEMLDESIDNFSIIVTSNLNQTPNSKYRKIIILTGDELGRLGMKPYQNQNVFCVFRIYNRYNRFDDDYIFPIPCGYNWTMHNDKTKKMSRMYPEKKLSEREYDIFFSGQPVPLRLEMMYHLNNIKSFKVLSQMNQSFRTGINVDDYYRLLGNTKISLAPDGTSVDTFRYVESFGSGCIVISTPKDNLWYYTGAPTVIINSWSELNDDLISRVLNMDIDAIYESNLKYYLEKLSEKSVADYMIEIINKKLCRS